MRAYEDFSYFEKHIVEILCDNHDRDKEIAVVIVNQYKDVLKIFKDGHETPHAFAEMFHDAYNAGTTSKVWIDNISKGECFWCDNDPEYVESCVPCNATGFELNINKDKEHNKKDSS